MAAQLPPESDLLEPVLLLFEIPGYHVQLEAKLSRKRIDVLLVPDTSTAPWISIELKVRDWKKALWQAAVNTQLSERTYIALWHTAVKTALDNKTLFNEYGVGIISVSETSAQVVLESQISSRPLRQKQQALLFEEFMSVKGKQERLDTLSLLPA